MTAALWRDLVLLGLVFWFFLRVRRLEREVLQRVIRELADECAQEGLTSVPITPEYERDGEL